MSDGDTVRLRFPDGDQERTRLIGIDRPETHPSQKLERDVQRSGRDRAAIQALGREATAFRRLVDGKTVEVESDVRKRDRYGRRLADLWLPHGRMVNVLIIRQGHAQPLTVPPNRRCAALFRPCGQEARDAGQASWRQP